MHFANGKIGNASKEICINPQTGVDSSSFACESGMSVSEGVTN